MVYGDKDTVYSMVGIDSTAVPEASINLFLEQADAEVDKIINSTCNPKIKIINKDGNGLPGIIVDYIPLLNVRALRINDDLVDTNTLRIDYPGRVRQKVVPTSRTIITPSREPNNISIKVEYGWLEETDVYDEISADVVKGEVILTVSDGSQFTEGEYIKIGSILNDSEVVKIKSIDANNITVNTYQDHPEGALVTKMQIPRIVVDLANTLAAIKTASYMIGNTYTFATSYQMPDYSVTKGVPYPHFEKSLNSAIQQRDYLVKTITKWVTMC